MPSTPQPHRRRGVAGIVAAVALIVVACSSVGQATVGPASPTAEATPAPTADATAAPTATPVPMATSGPLPADEATELSPGTYSLASFPVGVSFEVPDGWFSCSASPVEQSVCYEPPDGATVIAVAFLIVDNVVADPCSPGEEPLDPPVGPTVDDLVTAISNLEGFEATAPLEITVDGFDGKEFTVAAPADATCELKTWATSNRTNGVGAGEVNVLRILDVEGTRILISGAYHPQDPAPTERLAALLQVMDTVRLQP